MGWLPAIILASLLAASSASAQTEQPISVRTVPGGASVVSQPSGLRVATAGASDLCSWTARTDLEGVYQLLHPHFDPIELRLRWNASAGGWETDWGSRLDPELPLYFSKSTFLNVRPRDVRVYVVLRDLPEPDAPLDALARKSLSLGGVDYEVALLRQDSQGRITLPRAHDPPRLVLERSLFSPELLAFAEGELDSESRVFPEQPVHLRPLWGPLSYWQFQVAALLAGAGSAVALRRSKLNRQKVLETAQAISGKAETLVPPGELPDLEGETVRSPGGCEFRIAGPLGAGASGAVFKARDEAEEACAVKVLYLSVWRDPEFRERFLQEIDICSRLQHPGIVKLRDWGLILRGAEEWPFMVTDLVEGRQLRDAMRGRLDWRQAVGWIIELLDALEVAHQAGVIHRDLKPENVMLTASGAIRVMDFGVARRLDRETLTRTDEVLGTPRYMSPEHIDAKTVTPASDVYSVGVMLYEMLAGRPPFEAADNYSLLVKMMGETPPSLRAIRGDVPAELEIVVTRMMARKEQERHASAREARKALSGIAE
ncbi:MAG: serine/threonine protein kinase [Armatimonadetes bacterium]|nr:serine/threonine protein kinase [Armatimonadota bacterium]